MHGSSIIMSTALLGTTSAFSVRPELEKFPIINEQIEFRVLPGVCRTENLGAGAPRRLRLNQAQCKEACEFDEECSAYEYRNHLVCEIHTTPTITQVVPAPDDSVCGLKLVYVRFEGYCHTEEHPATIMKRTQGRVACEEECTNSPFCFGYEYASSPVDLDCELHFSKLNSIAPAYDGSTCDVIDFLNPGFPFIA